MELINNSRTQIEREQLGINPSAYIPFTAMQSEQHDETSSSKSFIEANTLQCSLKELTHDHIIPVWAKDNEPLISHADIIGLMQAAVREQYDGETILQPAIRVSHPIRGRIPSAKNKAALDLLEHEKTLYYERMMAVVDIPSIQAEVGGNILSLTVGCVKSFSDDHLWNRSGSDQRVRLFIGFKNTVCCNMCVWSDGYSGMITVRNLDGLLVAINSMLRNYNSSHQLHHLERLSEYFLTENQFAHLVGRLRMYLFLPPQQKKDIPPMLMGDNQINNVVRDYFKDCSFCRDQAGNINLWKLYNLFTGSNNTYIDQFLDRGVNAFNFVEQIRYGLENKTDNWYLNQD